MAGAAIEEYLPILIFSQIGILHKTGFKFAVWKVHAPGGTLIAIPPAVFRRLAAAAPVVTAWANRPGRHRMAETFLIFFDRRAFWKMLKTVSAFGASSSGEAWETATPPAACAAAKGGFFLTFAFDAFFILTEVTRKAQLTA